MSLDARTRQGPPLPHPMQVQWLGSDDAVLSRRLRHACFPMPLPNVRCAAGAAKVWHLIIASLRTCVGCGRGGPCLVRASNDMWCCPRFVCYSARGWPPLPLLPPAGVSFGQYFPIEPLHKQRKVGKQTKGKVHALQLAGGKYAFGRGEGCGASRVTRSSPRQRCVCG
eukprot:gene17932-biopygen23388